MTAPVGAALQICYTRFDATFFALPLAVQERIQASIDDLGLHLATFAHHRLKGSGRYRLRVGDYRVIYAIEVERNVLHLLAVGHRREIYRDT